jgi:ketopantoate reductase
VTYSSRKMKLGVIGTGNIGGTLARKLNAAGHDVLVANSRGREGVRAFVKSARRPLTRVELSRVSTSLSFRSPFSVAELPKDLFDAGPADVPIIDTGNVFEPLCQALYPHWSRSV